MKKYIVLGIIGAITAQIWGMVSWMVIPWHQGDFREFTDETAVVEVVRQNAPSAGLYMLPNAAMGGHHSEEQMNAWMEQAQAGPYAFMTILPNGLIRGMGPRMGFMVMINVVVSLLLIFLLGKASVTSIGERALFSGLVVSAGGLFTNMSNWNWWHFPTTYTIVNVVDLFIQWALVGLVITFVGNKLSLNK